MAYYTVRLRDVVESESHYGSPMKPTHKEYIEMGRQKIFDFDYPLFDESYRKEFETRFIRSFYMNEISEETFGLWKFKLDTWLNLHMPYYNQLYLSTLLEYDPLINTDYKVTSLAKKDNTQSDTGNRNQDTTGNKTKGKKFTDETIGKVDTDGNNETTGNTNTDTKVDGTDDTQRKDTTDTTRDVSGTDHTTEKTKDFERNLATDTPDSRLQITTNDDGTGVIEYASSIAENSKKGDRESDSTTGEKTTENKKLDSDSKNQSSETGNSKTNAKSNTTYHDEVSSKFNTNQLTDEDENSKGNLSEDTSKEMKANEVKDYIEHRVGKQGVETYPEMVMKFRKAMINVDEQILKAMRKELFMIIY